MEKGPACAPLLQPFASANVYIPAVNEGDIEPRGCTAHEVGAALVGLEHFEGRPPGGAFVRFGTMFPLRFGIFVRADSDIETLADLRGRTLPGGYSSQQIAATMMDAIYAFGRHDRGRRREDPRYSGEHRGGRRRFRKQARVDAFLLRPWGAAKVSERSMQARRWPARPALPEVRRKSSKPSRPVPAAGPISARSSRALQIPGVARNR